MGVHVAQSVQTSVQIIQKSSLSFYKIPHLCIEMTKTVSLKVGMTCNGCANAVTKVLSKVEGSFVLSLK